MTRLNGRPKVYKSKKKISVDFESGTLEKIDYLKLAYRHSSRSEIITMAIIAFYNAYIRKLGEDV